MARIFICYRREDASGHAGRLRDALSVRFGAGEIFRDIETIGPGDDFVQAMTRALDGCRVFLAVIGRDWLTLEGPDGRPRLLDPDDHVRREIAEALRRGVRVIPVLVEGAPMPRSQQLPADIRGLASRNAVALDDPGWSADLERLMAAIRTELGEPDMRASPPERHTQPATPPDVEARTPSRKDVLRRAAPAAVIVVLVVAALAALANLRGGDDEPPFDDPGADPSVVGGNPGGDPADNGPPLPAGGIAVTLPRGGAAELDFALYEILAATLAPDASGATLALRIRVTNRSPYTISFSRDGFRLVHGDRTDAPGNQLAELVESETTRDGDVTFEVPRGTRTATLRINHGSETGEVPLDLTGRTGPTPERDRLARSRGAHQFDVRFDGTRARMRFGDVTFTVRAAHVRRYANKLELSIDVRADNASGYLATFGDSQFRLIVDDLPRAPVGGLNELVQAASVKDGTIAFDLPFGVRDVVLRAYVGDASADLPLRLPAVD